MQYYETYNSVVYENGDKNSLNFNAMVMIKEKNFKVGHPIVFLANDNANISRHNYVRVYVSFLAAIVFDSNKSSSGLNTFVYKT